MGEIIVTLVWLIVFALVVGVIFALLSWPITMIAGAIWKKGRPRTIAFLSSCIFPVLLVCLYFYIMNYELTRTQGHVFSTDLLIHNFASFGIGVLMTCALAIFLGTRIGTASLLRRANRR